MSKSQKHHVYTQHDLLGTIPLTDNDALFEGLYISTNANFTDFTLMNTHFRTDFFSLFIVTRGQIQGTFNLQPFTTCKNDLLIAPPNAIKQLTKATPHARGIVIGFTPKFLSQSGIPRHSLNLFEYLTSAASPIWHMKPKDVRILKDLFHQILHRCQNVLRHPFGKEQLYSNFLIFLYELAAQYKTYGVKAFNQLTRKEDVVMRFAYLVREQFRTQRSVKHYAAALNLTPKYLTETVKEISGRNAGEIIDDFVIVESKLLLENPEYTIAQIASQLNFSDQSFFGKFFKRHMGISPKEFRLRRLP